MNTPDVTTAPPSSDFKPDRVLAWTRFRWTKAQGPALACARCDKLVRHGVIRQGTEHLWARLETRRKFHIICDACYRFIIQLENQDREVEK